MKKIIFIIFFGVLLNQGIASAFQYDGQKELEEAKKALSEVNYEYSEPKIFVDDNSDAYLPKDVFPKKVEYRRYSTQKHQNVRTDYYTKPSFFKKQKLILRKIHIFSNNEKDLRYIIYTDINNNIEWFVKFLPSYIKKKDGEKEIERRVEESLVFKGDGELYRRDVDTFILNHDLKRATFESIRYNSRGEIKSKESGDWNYYQLMGIDDH